MPFGLDDARTYIALLALILGLIGGGGISALKEKRREQASKVAAWVEPTDNEEYAVYVRNNSDRIIRDVRIRARAPIQGAPGGSWILAVSTVGPLRTVQLPLGPGSSMKDGPLVPDLAFRDAEDRLWALPHDGRLTKMRTPPKAETTIEVVESIPGSVNDEAKDSIIGKFEQAQKMTQTSGKQDYRIVSHRNEVGHQLFMPLKPPGVAIRLGNTLVGVEFPSSMVLQFLFDDTERHIVEVSFINMPESPLHMMRRTEDFGRTVYTHEDDSIVLMIASREKIESVTGGGMIRRSIHLARSGLIGYVLIDKQSQSPLALVFANASKNLRPDFVEMVDWYRPYREGKLIPGTE